MLGVGAVLVAAVTFAVAFSPPGGYGGDGGGAPALAGQYPFDAFMYAVAIAFAYSMLATFSLMYSSTAAVRGLEAPPRVLRAVAGVDAAVDEELAGGLRARGVPGAGPGVPHHGDRHHGEHLRHAVPQEQGGAADADVRVRAAQEDGDHGAGEDWCPNGRRPTAVQPYLRGYLWCTLVSSVMPSGFRWEASA